MGCAGSRAKPEEPVKKIRKPKPWKHSEPITRMQLVQMRDEFWDTAPHYGGRKGCLGWIKWIGDFRSKGSFEVSELFETSSESYSSGVGSSHALVWDFEIWDALRAAAEEDLTLAQAIIDTAGVIVQNLDLTICYDERGAKYELPKYVLSEPTNLIRES